MGVKWNALFKTEEELQTEVDAYFKHCDDVEEPYTTCGLALALGTSRKTLCEWEKKSDWQGNIIKKAKAMVEYAGEVRLLKRGNAGDIFWLKNHGWSDTTEQKHTFGDIQDSELKKQVAEALAKLLR